MKQLFRFWIAAALLIVAGCVEEYDDSEVWNSINALEKRMTAMETVTNAYENNLLIKSVDQIEGGYVITFSDGSQATIANGKDGQDGKDGDTYIADIVIGENEVTFILTDGKSFSIPLYSALSIEFAESDLVVMSPNSTREMTYTVTSATETVKVEVTSSADIKAKVVADDANGMTGKIHITTGDAIDEYSKVIVFVSNGDKVIMRSITFEEAGLVVEENATKQATAEGGEMTLEFLSNVECEVVIPEDAQSWISLVPSTRAMEKRTITLKLEPNKGAARSAEVMVQSIDKDLSLIYTVSQEPDSDYQLALEREALIAIYNALDGDNWINNENWCSDKPVSEWYGVVVDYDMCVTKLMLTDNNLKGTIPQEIKNLTKLKTACLRGDFDFFPVEICYCTTLETLYMAGCDMTGDIPNDIKNLKHLKHLNLQFQNLSGTIPIGLFELVNLESLNLDQNQLTGEIPKEIGNLIKLRDLALYDNMLTGAIPNEIGQCVSLENIWISNNKLEGKIPEEILNCKNLKTLNFTNNSISGQLPDLSRLDSLGQLGISYNGIYGQYPDWLLDDCRFQHSWGYHMKGNDFDFSESHINAPQFEVIDLNGNIINSESEYSSRRVTIIHQWGGCHAADPSYIDLLKDIYDTYKVFGLDIIGMSGYGGKGMTLDEVSNFINEHNIEWRNVYNEPGNRFVQFIVESSVTDFFPDNSIPNIVAVNSKGEIIFSLELQNISSLFQIIKSELDVDVSTDYSKDGTVTTLQTATKGEGIDVVLMGDAYSDRQIADGTYKADMEYIYNNLFTEEPYKSFKDYFNVHYVNVVSATEGYEHGNTALDTFFGDSTYVGGSDNACFEYALNAISENDMDEALIIVSMNSDNYAGTCYMYYPTYTTGTYGSGPSVAYFPRGGDATTFAQLLHHEACGHGFAKLADEYAYEDMGAIPSDYVSEIQAQQNSWGWWKNVDFTSDPTATRWSHFVNDTRYANDGLGAYEGGLTYWSGVWRPTENSIMRYNTGGFNAPSREAIYYRIHKLAYGDSWEYDYEDFVEWDARNRTTAATRAMVYKPANYKPTHPPVIVNKSWKDAK